MYVSFLGSDVEDYKYRKDLEINGIYAFLTKLRNIFKTFNKHPDYDIENVYCFWDGKSSGQLRRDIYPKYKISRYEKRNNLTEEEKLDKEIFKRQVERIKDYLPFLSIKSYTDDLVETDDMVSYYIQNKKENEHVLIVSSDIDLFQLINDQVYAYNLIKRKALTDRFPRHYIITPKNFKKIYGYTHKNIPIYKSICGDTSDDIEGVGGIQINGLLKQFPAFKDEKYTLDRIHQEIESERLIREEKKKKLPKKLLNIVEKTDLINLNTKLVDLSNLFITDSCIENLNNLINSDFPNKKSGGLKKILTEDRIIEEIKIDMNYLTLNEFFYPFKKYINLKKI